MTQTIQILASVVGFSCALFAIHLVTTARRNLATRVLALLFAVFAVQAMFLILVVGGEPPLPVRIARPTIAMMIGPLCWLFFAALADPDYRCGRADLAHFLPAGIVFLELWLQRYPLDIDAAIVISFAVYCALLIRLDLRNPGQFSRLSGDARLARWWLRTGWILLGVSCVGEVAIVFEMIGSRPLAHSTSLLAVFVVNMGVVTVVLLTAMKNPSPLLWLYRLGRRSSGLSTEQCVKYANQFETMVVETRLHLEDGLTVARAASAMGLSPRMLSESINRTYGESFSRRLNRIRIQTAAKMLTERDDSVTEIMFAAGFRTKSSFNKEFRSLKGKSPTEYREATQRIRTSQSS